ncbi:MAG: protein translocase subunit SecF [Deltaproteobacteria bacterium CG_4_10_14_0_2_um_filter_43_8]|nr:MAG: protein translocase subunit SecF [Deltaproteobacteria bacterium CG11_big_fil_rev_8_21_14_0_20_42_23]PJA21610.1 MAG: protein translocase subunit SecF [Deltaproteobacteria bacterium CG_4_10_14_0_2_um_filter_43_8]PJC63586.1 MAG: protein translocase subunit SecF [Deltaproteobacteria bacterium CG_4_9_14_0_2_um_filter_42_21]
MKTFHFDFMKYRVLFLLMSSALVAFSIFAMVKKGFNYGIDFKGGAKLEYQFKEAINEQAIRDALKDLNLGDMNVVRFGDPEERRMSIKVGLPEEHASISDPITAALAKQFGEENVQLDQEVTVGPKVGKDLRTKAWLTILTSWLIMLIYIGFRFDFNFAPGAVVALIHDVTITLGLFAWMGKEINLTILAAILTLIGYSVNDTIVVFDRIRENKADISPSTVLDVINSSINSTLGRTIITSLTVLFVVLVLFYRGGGTLHDFAFALTVGTIVGTYSSIFVASPLYIWMYRLMSSKK